MTERLHSSQSGLKIVGAIGQEFERALERERKGSWLRRIAVRRSRRTVALALAGGLVAAGAAGAVGVLGVGGVIPAGEPRGPAGYRPNIRETVLAQGTTPVAGPWRITGYKSERKVDNGEEVQPTGLPCLRLVLTDPPEGAPLLARFFCGERGKAGFSAAALPVSDGSGRTEFIVFGEAPEQADTVELTADGGKRIRAQMYDGPTTVPGDIWVMSAPVGLENPELGWLDPGGRSGGTTLDAPRELDMPPPHR